MSCFGASNGKSGLFWKVVLGGGVWVLLVAPQAGSNLYLLGRYEEEGHKHATAENDFVVFKKVRVRVSCSTWILSAHSAQSPVWSWEARGWKILARYTLISQQGSRREIGHLPRHRDPRTRSNRKIMC